MKDNIIDKILLDSGYIEHDMSESIFHKYATKFFQKKIKDEKGIKYHITVYKYDGDYGIPYEFEIQFSKDGKYAMNSTIFAVDCMSVEDIEHEFEELWSKLGFDYYEEY